MEKKRSLEYISISDKDLQLPSFLTWWTISSELWELLPAMATTFRIQDWSVLLKYTVPLDSTDSSLSTEYALKYELVAVCLWFLFTKVSLHVKEGVVRAMTFISSVTSDAADMSIDQTFVDDLVVRVLHSGNVEVQRQVCCGLAFLVGCSDHLTFTFGACIQDQLLQLIRTCNSDLITPILRAIREIARISEGMREKIVETELLCSWLAKLMSEKDDKSFMKEACWTVGYITGGNCDGELWDHIKDYFIPAIIKVPNKTWEYESLTEAAAYAISEATSDASSEQIEVLFELGCLKFLLDCLWLNGAVLHLCLNGIKNILRAGDGFGPDDSDDELSDDGYDTDDLGGYNKYAELIDGYDKGWKLFDVGGIADFSDVEIEALKILKKYRPGLFRSDYWTFRHWF